MSPTTTRVALRRAGTLLVAAALVGGPVSVAFADPTGEPTPTATASAPVETPAPSASAEPTETASASPSPSASEDASPTPEPSPSAEPKAAAKPAAKTAFSALAASPSSDAAAAFIARTLGDNGDHYNYPASTYFDGGNTIDALIALSAIGGQQAQAAETLAYLEANLGSYTGSSFGELYAGSAAKSLVGVLAAGGDPTDFAGTNLVEDLQGLETSSGRFSDDSQYGDYSNVFGQSLALIGLSRAGAPLSAASVELLLAQQCSDGGFRGSIGGSGCTSDPDATAFAAQALIAASGTLVCGTGADGLPARAADAADEALARLAALQGSNGGIVGSEGEANANTTGVAAQAFTAGGRTTDADEAISFLATLQYDDSVAALEGGLAYSDTTRSTTTPSDTDLRATPQGALGLAGGSLVDALVEEGQDPPAATECPAEPTTTSEPTSTGGSSPTTTTPPAGSDGGETVSPVASGPDALAQTGSDLLWPVGAGLVLVAAGALTVAASRRRGAHA